MVVDSIPSGNTFPLSPLYGVPVTLRAIYSKVLRFSGVDAPGISITSGLHPVSAVARYGGWWSCHHHYAMIQIEPINTTSCAVLLGNACDFRLRTLAKTPRGGNYTPILFMVYLDVN